MVEFVKVIWFFVEYLCMLNWFVNFDVDEDGFIVFGEFVEGFCRNCVCQICCFMDVDVDGNGCVIMQEYVLSYVFCEGCEKVEEQGQKKWFNDFDFDDDGFVVEQEVIDFYCFLDIVCFWGYVLVYCVGMVDVDSDGWILCKEFGVVFVEVEGCKCKKFFEEVEVWFDQFDGEVLDELWVVLVNVFFGCMQYWQDKDFEWMFGFEVLVCLFLMFVCVCCLCCVRCLVVVVFVFVWYGVLWFVCCYCFVCCCFFCE